MVSKKKGASKKENKSKEAVKSKVNQSREAASQAKGKASQSKEGVSQTKTGKQDNSKETISGFQHHDTDDGMLKVMGKALVHNHWFHGLMPRDEIEELLKNEGDFLLRKTEVERKPRYAVSVCRHGQIKHILLTFKGGQWALRDTKRATVTDLILAHIEEKIPVMSDGTLLITGIPRPDFYILHEHIELKKKLGAGAFGEVHVGVWKKNDQESIEVAVKKLKGMMHKRERIEFVKEAKIMRRLDNPNIVKVYGVAPQEEPMMIILEFASGGSLKGKLKDNPDIPTEKLLQFCIDAARGMCYLSGRQVIHRDIAARNCLLGKNDELKISDFGLSIADRSLVKLDKLKSMPVKWLAPETLKKGEFSKKTDVWSYGVLVWEIFSRCQTDPFPGETNAQAKSKILSGKPPMKAPDGAPPIVNQVMEMCFTQEPQQRPEFEGIFKLLAPNEKAPVTQDNQFETYAS